MIVKNRKDQRRRRHMRLRQRVQGTAERPRMAIYISNKHMYVQFIDDTASHTLAATSTLAVEDAIGCNLNTAKVVGEQAAKTAAKHTSRVLTCVFSSFFNPEIDFIFPFPSPLSIFSHSQS